MANKHPQLILGLRVNPARSRDSFEVLIQSRQNMGIFGYKRMRTALLCFQIYWSSPLPRCRHISRDFQNSFPIQAPHFWRSLHALQTCATGNMEVSDTRKSVVIILRPSMTCMWASLINEESSSSSKLYAVS